jgi:hypothetical protein
MENLNLNNKNCLIEKISSIKIFNLISCFLNNKKSYIIPLFLSNLNPQFHKRLEIELDTIINKKSIEENSKIELKRIIALNKFFLNCRKIYKEYAKSKETYNDPIIELYNKIDKSENNLILNYTKYFYYFLLDVPYINLAPFCSLMNVIYFNEYYKNINKKPKIVNLILYLNDDVAKSRINDFFGGIILKPNDYNIKFKNINFNAETFMKIISDLYKLFDEPLKIIVNGDNKNIKHNFGNKTTFIFDQILFKLIFKSNSLFIIQRV